MQRLQQVAAVPAHHAEGVGDTNVGRLVLGVLDLGCGQVDEGAFHWVLLITEDEDVGATHRLKVTVVLEVVVVIRV